MGRGRQKAKHTKVARELKYFSPDTNYSQLERELTSGESGDPILEDNLAKWAEYADDSEEQAFDDDESDDVPEEEVKLA